MSVRVLSGMNYRSVELKHHVRLTMPEILFQLAAHFQNHSDDHGIITSLTTQSHPDNEHEFLTTLVYSY